MRRVKWFLRPGFLILLHYAKALATAAWEVATQYIGNNHKQKEKGGSSSEKEL